MYAYLLHLYSIHIRQNSSLLCFRCYFQDNHITKSYILDHNYASKSPRVPKECKVVSSEANAAPKKQLKTNPGYCKCGQKKVYKFGRVYSKCPSPSCNIYWCLVKDCGYKTTYLGTVKAHIDRHLLVSDPDKCFHCGNKKYRGTKNVGQCKACKVFWCLTEECRHEYRSLAFLKSHKKRFCKGSPKNICTCGNIKTPTPNKNKGVCSVCNRYWCMVANCFREFAQEHALESHQMTHRRVFDKTKCFNCNSTKPIHEKNATFSQCGTCGMFWCLIDNCEAECLTDFNLETHQHRAHKVENVDSSI